MTVAIVFNIVVLVICTGLVISSTGLSRQTRDIAADIDKCCTQIETILRNWIVPDRES